MSFKAGFIAVIGSPNVGKSTLINELIGQKLAITSHKPQTTRHRIHAIDSTDNYQMVFVDTPGIHLHHKKAINTYMNKVASGSIATVDMILWLIEAGKWSAEDKSVLTQIMGAEVPIILCVNKIDKLKNYEAVLPDLQKIGQKYQPNELFPLSAFNKKDIQNLRIQILKYLPVQSPIFPENFITDSSEQFIVAEFIREKLMRHLHDELPYDLTVGIEKYQLDGKMQRISAEIYVDKIWQKGAVIGAQGQMLKLISTEARHSIEGFLGRKVFLQLWVKVAKGWANDKAKLASFGYLLKNL